MNDNFSEQNTPESHPPVAEPDRSGENEVRTPGSTGPKKRRRGSRGGRNRSGPRPAEGGTAPSRSLSAPVTEVELPERLSEGRPDADAAERALVPRPKIGDTRPAPPPVAPSVTMPGGTRVGGPKPVAKRKPVEPVAKNEQSPKSEGGSGSAKKKRRRGTRGRTDARPVAEVQTAERRRGRERNGRPIGRYFMCVQVRENLTQVAVMEGRSLIEHYVSHPADDIGQIHGNIYVGRVQNVLPGMEAAFVDIGTPKNAVLYRGDVQYDAEDIVDSEPRIEQILKGRQLIVCQVTKNPIGVKGARLTQEVSLPGRFVVLIPNSKTYGISKRLPDDERKRLRNILDRVKPAEHGLIVRTAAESATEHELRADMTRLL
ncbi:MAG: ribonuclease E/G, partial [Actinomycetota bacterium]